MKMLKNVSSLFVLMALVAVSLLGCKKDKDENTSGSKNVKYEITGNFTGKFTVLYSDNASGNTVIDNVSLPWSKEVTYGSDVIAIAIGATTTTAGAAGQTAVIKIYVGGNVVKTSNGIAGSMGELSIPSLGHGFY